MIHTIIDTFSRITQSRAASVAASLVSQLIATVLAFLLPSRISHLNVLRILVVGLGLAGLFLFTAGYIVPGGASEFLVWADALVNGSTINRGVDRDIGFPLLLVLSGYTLTGSFIGITVLHAVFAVLAPLFIYMALRPFSLGVAYYSGQMGNICLGSFQFIKLIHHDQTYIFFMTLMITWIIIFFTSNKYRYLYLFTAASLAASVSRPAGNLLFPVLLLIAFVAAPRPRHIRHYLFCAAIFAATMASYQWYRYQSFDMRDQASIPSYVGAQVFYNTYMNSQEYGITLGPEIGPNMRQLDDALRTALGPVLQDSKFLRDHAAGSKPFAAANFIPFSRDELMRRIYLVPNWEYYLLLCDAEPNDQVLLRAAIEIAETHPFYVLRYTLRNLTVFLFHPGYAHTRYNLAPFGPIGLDFYPPLAGIEPGEQLPPRALNEAKFDRLSALSPLVRTPLLKLNLKAGALWTRYYQSFVDATSILIVIAWLGLTGTAICALERWRRGRAACAGAALWSQPGFAAALASASVLLLYNAGVTAAFAEPDFRYHHFILLLRVLTAGFGAIIVLRIISLRLKIPVTHSFIWQDIAALNRCYRQGIDAIASYDLLATWFSGRRRLAVMIFAFAAVAVAAGWTTFMLRYAG